MGLEFLKEGSSKDIYRVDKTSLAFRFTKRFSVFDVGACPQEIPGKDVAICKAAVKSFEIAQAIGVPTHFMEQLDEVTIRVREVQIIGGRPLTFQDTDCLTPAEWITRSVVAGSLLEKFKSGKAKPTAYGFITDDVPAEGTPLPWTVKHRTTKLEKIDRDLTHEEALALCGLTLQDEEQIWDMIVRLDGAIALAWYQAGYICFDGKKEVAVFGQNRQKIIVDTCGTQDEDRPVKRADLLNNDVQHYGKEAIRQYFKKTGFYAAVQSARKENRPDPEYPLIPEEVMADFSRRYTTFANDYSAVQIG